MSMFSSVFWTSLTVYKCRLGTIFTLIYKMELVVIFVLTTAISKVKNERGVSAKHSLSRAGQAFCIPLYITHFDYFDLLTREDRRSTPYFGLSAASY